MSLGHITAIENRVLRVRRRCDLQVHKGVYQGENSWIIKDPIALTYHRLRAPEIAVWEMLDGQTSLKDLQERLQHLFPTKKIRLTDLQGLLSSFHKSGLVIADTVGQGSQMLHRHREKRRREWRQRFSNILSIRFPGFDPERILTWMHPHTSWLFSRRFMAFWCVLTTAALVHVIAHVGDLQDRLPALQQFFAFKNLFWLALVTSAVKIVHEFGHGLSCKHFGGECHEIGAMLLVLTPALYCDTSDSWTLPNKWHRAFIGAAGMYMEVLMASIATFVWWYTQPGLINFMALNVMFVCSISTVLFNSNPLLRYDGYYILSDILEIPNLSQKSRAAMLNILRTKCLGLDPIPNRQLPQRGQIWFGVYSVASFFYRWFVLAMIMWFLYRFFEPYGLDVIGHGIIVFSLVGLIVMPMWQLGKFFSVPGRIREVKPARFSATCVAVLLVLSGIAFVPVPSHVYSPLVIRPNDAKRIYVKAPGTIRELNAKYGDVVQAGDVVARLENIDLRTEVIRLESELSRQERYLENLRARQGLDPAIDAQIPRSDSIVSDLQQQLKQRRSDVERLELRTTIAGTFLPPPERPQQPVDAATSASWSGRPLDAENLGATLEVDTIVGSVGDPKRMKALVMVDQRDIGLVAPGDQVTIMLDEAGGKRAYGVIHDVAQTALKQPPPELAAASGGEIPTETDKSGVERPLFVYYQANVPIDQADFPLVSGFRGRAKITIQSESIGRKIVRIVRNLVHFR